MSVGNLFQARIDLYQTERNIFKSFDRFTWRVAPFVFQMTDFNFANNRFPFRKLQIFGFISQPLNDIIQTTEARLHADAKRELCNVREWFVPPIKHFGTGNLPTPRNTKQEQHSSHNHRTCPSATCPVAKICDQLVESNSQGIMLLGKLSVLRD